MRIPDARQTPGRPRAPGPRPPGLRTHLLRAAVIVLAIFAAGCSSDRPGAVADRFWAAARAGDLETVRALSIESEIATLELEEGEGAIDSYELGEVAVDGERALVETRIRSRGDHDIEVDFETVLVRVDGEWKVHLDETGERMIGALLGGSLHDAVEGMMEGVSEGIRGLGEALERAADELDRSRDRNRDP